jgi:hypothetical protein
MFYFVESRDRLAGKIAEETAATQVTTKTAFNAAQSRYAHRSSCFSPQKRMYVGLASKDRRTSISIFKSHGWPRPPRAEGDNGAVAHRLPHRLFSFGTACSTSAARDGKQSPESWQLCRQLGKLAVTALPRLERRHNFAAQPKGVRSASCQEVSLPGRRQPDTGA